MEPDANAEQDPVSDVIEQLRPDVPAMTLPAQMLEQGVPEPETQTATEVVGGPGGPTGPCEPVGPRGP